MGEQVVAVPEVKIDVTRMPRIPPLSYADADDKTKAVWDAMRHRPDDPRPGPDGDNVVFRTFMHNAELFKAHSPFVQHVKNGTAIPVRHRELAIMRSAWNCGADDQWVKRRPPRWGRFHPCGSCGVRWPISRSWRSASPSGSWARSSPRRACRPC